MSTRGRAGFTLVETLVSLAVLAVSLGVVTGTLVRAGQDTAVRDDWSARLEAGRSDAIETGRPVTVWPDSAHENPPVRFLPDGRVVGRLPTADSMWGRP